MAQLILREVDSRFLLTTVAHRRDMLLRRGDVVEVLPDGQHPGRSVVAGNQWNGVPRAGWQIVHCPGAQVDTFSFLLETGVVPVFVGRNYIVWETRAIRAQSLDMAGMVFVGRTHTTTSAAILARSQVRTVFINTQMYSSANRTIALSPGLA